MAFFFINETDFFGIIMNGLTINITGDVELTLYLVFILLLLFSMSFGIPTEYIIPILLPFLIIMMANGSLLGVAIFFIFIMIIMLLRMWFI